MSPAAVVDNNCASSVDQVQLPKSCQTQRWDLLNMHAPARASKSGCTIWLTGLSGAGKSTLASALELYLIEKGIFCYILDGDNLRDGLCSDLSFSAEDRHENIRRVSQVAKLFADSGAVTICSFVSPFVRHRSMPRDVHVRAGLPFFEVFVDTPLEVCERRDVKGLYKRARAGQIKQFTGIDQPYERPERPDLLVTTVGRSVDDCRADMTALLARNGIIPSDLAPHTEISWNGDMLEKIMAKDQIEARFAICLADAPRIELAQIDLQWLQVLTEGWAWPLSGFMTEYELLQCLHFDHLHDRKSGLEVSQSIPIVLPIDSVAKAEIEDSKMCAVVLTYASRDVGVIINGQVYEHRKEERLARQFGTVDQGHPVVKLINDSGDWLLGGQTFAFDRIRWHDGLDKFRYTPAELRTKFGQLDADCVFAFQLRNPIHNGHALLIQDTRRRLEAEMGHKNVVLLLHPLGGWTKSDDVPLPVRMAQHQALIDADVLSRKSTVLAIFPSPMSYAGPTEVLWHAKARLVAGAQYYIVGRDPAGVKHPSKSGEDLYEPTQGGKLLQLTTKLQLPTGPKLEIVPFKVAAYDKLTGKMDFFDPNRRDDFCHISGTEMRRLARDGHEPPPGFMHPNAWEVLTKYYNQL